jgi:serine/threonine-protein kinase
MEFLAGQCVAALLDEPLPVRQAVSIARQIATGLAAAHGAGVVHADVTASNIFVAEDGSAKLVDFGLAQLGDEPKVADGAQPVEYVFGTPSYIAPEQIRGQRATERSDQYSLGIVLFEMIVGEPPFVAPNTRDLCMKHLQAPVPELRSPHGQVPRALVDVVNRCLAKKPDARFGSTAELVQALAAVEQALAATGWHRWLTP